MEPLEPPDATQSACRTTDGEVAPILSALRQWYVDEPFERFARHYLSVAARANQLCDNEGDHDMGKGLALFAQEWLNLKRGWEWSRERMAEDDAAARLCTNYLAKTAGLIRH